MVARFKDENIQIPEFLQNRPHSPENPANLEEDMQNVDLNHEEEENCPQNDISTGHDSQSDGNDPEESVRHHSSSEAPKVSMTRQHFDDSPLEESMNEKNQIEDNYRAYPSMTIVMNNPNAPTFVKTKYCNSVLSETEDLDVTVFNHKRVYPFLKLIYDTLDIKVEPLGLHVTRKKSDFSTLRANLRMVYPQLHVRSA